MNDYSIINLFPIPLIKFKFKYHDLYFFENIEKCENKPEGWELPLNTSFPNIGDNDNLISRQNRDQLKKDIKFCICEVFSQMKLPINFKFKDFWYNIYHKGQGQELHEHLSMVDNKLPYWSGIYYNKNSSPTEFIRPSKLYQTQLFPGYENCEINESYFYSFRPVVEDGDILLFPPYLSHSVSNITLEEPNMRLTFSFNMELE